MNSNLLRSPLFVIVILVISTTFAAYLLPLSDAAAAEGGNQLRLMFAMAMAASMCGASYLFLSGANVFKADLRVAYRWFAGGLSLFGLALLQWPTTIFFGLSHSAWATSGVIVVPFICATAFMFVGMRRFTHLLSIHTTLASWRFVLSVVAAATVLSGIASHFLSSHDTPGIGADTYTATVAWSLTFGLFAWLLILKVCNVIGVQYQRSMKGLALALGALTLTGVCEYITSYFMDENDTYIQLGFSNWPFIITGFLFIYAGYLFSSRITTSAKSSNVKSDVDREYIDGIATTAMLASRPKDIDVILDGLRRVTSSSKPGSSLSPQDRAKLVTVYLELEQYLITSDPLRSFTKEQLRHNLGSTFRSRLSSKTH